MRVWVTRQQDGVQVCKAAHGAGGVCHVLLPENAIGTYWKPRIMHTHLQDGAYDSPVKVTIILELLVHACSDLQG